VLRAIDKFDRLGWEGVEALLGKGRLDESGDFTKGAGLGAEQIQGLFIFFALGGATGLRTEDKIIGDRSRRPVGDFLTMAEVPEGTGEFLNIDAGPARAFDNLAVLEAWTEVLDDNPAGMAALAELRTILEMSEAAGYGSQRIQLSSSVVRGLEYYTGPVFEAELLFETKNDKGEPARFGSVGGGGRYDGLVGRFRGENVPATGFSIGVSRLMAALSALGKVKSEASLGPVVVLVLDRDRIGDYQRLTTSLRNAGIAAELYLGESGMKAQMKYADRRNAPCVVIQGSDERAAGTVQIKDLALGKALSAG
jgi:histidyl-tRNA synthetase